jgi:DNA-binding NarL/FixJ family response regulator
MTHVVLCDPPSALRDALARRLAEVPGVAALHVVDDIGGLEALVARRQPDVVLVASQLPEVRPSVVVRYLRHQAPGTRILMLTMGTDPEDVVAGIGAGAVGYLARDAVLPEVAAALAMVPAPESAPPPDRALESVVDLTDRELQVLEGMSRGRSNSEIGNDLFLSEDTIKTHARRLFRKMRVRDRAHAVAEGFRRGLLR